MKPKLYRVNDVFGSYQGEGKRAGEPSIFIRFTGCNMRCDLEPGPKSPGGFKCDTEFESGSSQSLQSLLAWVAKAKEISGVETDWIVLTGGEPGLQLHGELIDGLHAHGYKLQVESNGSVPIDSRVDWITISPKVAEHAIVQRFATEVKYVRGYGQALPKTVVEAEHYLISPAFDSGRLHPQTLEWCKHLCEGTKWEVSVQTHQIEGVR